MAESKGVRSTIIVLHSIIDSLILVTCSEHIYLNNISYGFVFLFSGFLD